MCLRISFSLFFSPFFFPFAKTHEALECLFPPFSYSFCHAPSSALLACYFVSSLVLLSSNCLPLSLSLLQYFLPHLPPLLFPLFPLSHKSPQMPPSFISSSLPSANTPFSITCLSYPSFRHPLPSSSLPSLFLPFSSLLVSSLSLPSHLPPRPPRSLPILPRT